MKLELFQKKDKGPAKEQQYYGYLSGIKAVFDGIHPMEVKKEDGSVDLVRISKPPSRQSTSIEEATLTETFVRSDVLREFPISAVAERKVGGTYTEIITFFPIDAQAGTAEAVVSLQQSKDAKVEIRKKPEQIKLAYDMITELVAKRPKA